MGWENLYRAISHPNSGGKLKCQNNFILYLIFIFRKYKATNFYFCHETCEEQNFMANKKLMNFLRNFLQISKICHKKNLLVGLGRTPIGCLKIPIFQMWGWQHSPTLP